MKLNSLVTKFKTSWTTIKLVLVVSAFLIGIILFIHFWKGHSFGMLTRDITAIFDTSPLTGFVSQIGIFIWSASATVCMFSAMVLSNLPNNKKIKHFLIASGILTLILGLDDTFLLHEDIFPRFGISENIVLFCYLGFVTLLLLK